MAVLSFVVDDFALATLPAGADEAGGPPPTKFHELRDNLPAALFVLKDAGAGSGSSVPPTGRGMCTGQ